MQKEIMSRQRALDRGLTRYRSGRPCKYGHDSDRYAKSGMCVKCVLTYNRRAARKRMLDGHEMVDVTFTVHRDDVETLRHTAEYLHTARRKQK